METDSAHTLATLGHPRRLDIVRLLMRRYPDRVPAGEIAAALDLKASTLSAYLSALTKAGIVTQQRAGTSLQYSVNMEEMRGVLDFLLLDCCRGRPDASSVPSQAEGLHQPERPNVLFLCTGNSARSIFAEAILRDMAPDRFTVYSAGSDPYPAPHVHALSLLREKGHAVAGLRSKSVAEFLRPDAPEMDFVFTVCDRAANETDTLWPGQPITSHFGTPDPVRQIGDDATRQHALRQAYRSLKRRIAAFTSGFAPDMTRIELQQVVDDAARLEGFPS